MPIYDYRCDHCGHAFSAVQPFKDEPVAACPSCGKPPRRLMTMPAIVFKGSGWYKTDSRASSPAGREAAKEAAKEKASQDGGTGSVDKKPAPAPDKTSSSAS